MLRPVRIDDDGDDAQCEREEFTRTDYVAMRPEGQAVPTADRVTRWLHRSVLPLHVQWAMRDEGHLRALVDSLSSVAAMCMALVRPDLAWCFLRLRSRATVTKYGVLRHRASPREYLEVVVPTAKEREQAQAQAQARACLSDGHHIQAGSPPTLLFVHGGAWGSGATWMYLLIAQAWLGQVGGTVILVGYEVYPHTDAAHQSARVGDAVNYVRAHWNDLGCTGDKLVLMGHSSGAHISALYLLQSSLRTAHAPVDAFVGLSGCYDIARHYAWERARGLHQVSPMKPANGGPTAFTRHSPSHLCLQLSEAQATTFPPTLLVHGHFDDTVPFTSTEQFAQALRERNVYCDTAYLELGDHMDTFAQLMWTRETVVSKAITAFLNRIDRINSRAAMPSTSSLSPSTVLFAHSRL